MRRPGCWRMMVRFRVTPDEVANRSDAIFGLPLQTLSYRQRTNGHRGRRRDERIRRVRRRAAFQACSGGGKQEQSASIAVIYKQPSTIRFPPLSRLRPILPHRPAPAARSDAGRAPAHGCSADRPDHARRLAAGRGRRHARARLYPAVLDRRARLHADGPIVLALPARARRASANTRISTV
jgi:hypothetical protein